MSNRQGRRERRELERQAKKLTPVEVQKPSSWYWLAPCIAAFAIYLPSLSFGFIRNDLTEISRISTAWGDMSSPLHGFSKYYRPAFSIWMVFVHSLAGLNTSTWHFSSVVLHVAATAAVFWLCAELLKRVGAASFAALLFAIYPIHIDAVCWLLASNEMMYTASFLAALVLFLKRGNSARLYWLSVLMWTVSVFSKETAVVLTLIFLVLAFADETSSRTRRILLATPFVAVSGAYLAIRSVVASGGAFGSKLAGLSWSTLLYTSPFTLLSYLGKLVWPVGLSPLYDPHLHLLRTPMMWVLGASLFSSAVLVIVLGRKQTAVLIGVALLLLPLIPALYVIRFSPDIEMIQDRYLYLPSAGFCLLVGFAASRIWQSRFKYRRALVGMATAACIASAILCLTQEGVYASASANYARAAELMPSNLVLMNDLGNAYLDEGRYPQAIELFQGACRAIADQKCLGGIATGLYQMKRYAEAQGPLEQIVNLFALYDRRDADGLVLDEEYLLWLEDTDRHLGDETAANRVAHQADEVGREIRQNSEAIALARNFGIPIEGGTR